MTQRPRTSPIEAGYFPIKLRPASSMAVPLPPNIGAIVHRPWCRIRPCGSECTCVPERWQATEHVLLTIDPTGRIKKETRQ